MTIRDKICFLEKNRKAIHPISEIILDSILNKQKNSEPLSPVDTQWVEDMMSIAEVKSGNG